jgi:hypothetical protein
MQRAAGKRFDSNRARSGTEIKKPRSFYSRRENIEERFAETIRSRPRP